MAEANSPSLDLDEQKLSVEDSGIIDGINELDIEENSIIQKFSPEKSSAIEEEKSSELEFHSNSSSSREHLANDDYDIMSEPSWINQKCHIFILSNSGKPIYSLNGEEDKISHLFGVISAIVSVIEDDDNDDIKSIKTKDTQFVFLIKTPLILCGVYKSKRSEQQITNQLSDVYNQILSIVTLSHMNSIFEKRKNYDLRKLLAGSERLIDHLLSYEKFKKVSNNPFVALTHSVRILPLEPSIRDTITSTIQSNCSKIKNLVFAVLLANNKLITLIRMKNYYIHIDDLRLIFNLVECTESFKSAESWTPICLPKFDPNGFLHAHVSYLSDDCEACLLLLSCDNESFFTLSDAKKNITDKLRRSHCMEAINEGMKNRGVNLKTAGTPEIRHFLYKNKKNTQLLCSEITMPYNTLDEFEKLEDLYYQIHGRIHNPARPLKLIYEMKETEIMLAWVTANYEFYASFEPLLDKKAAVIAQVNKLLKWIGKEENTLFMTGTHIF